MNSALFDHYAALLTLLAGILRQLSSHLWARDILHLVFVLLMYINCGRLLLEKTGAYGVEPL